jgi:prepilin-type N-terminal cleavage/methylation domain-containing protein
MAGLKTSLREFSMHRNQKGMSLVEILVAIVVSTIVISAAYASYSVISKNYEFQKDMKYMSQSARAVVKMIARDVRMAGYTEFNKQQITEAVKITDSSGTCCDRIDIVYDKSSSERIKISYYTQQYNNRYRLMKKIDKCTNSDCSSTSTLQSAQPIADYVEDLQFNGFKNGKVASTGAVEYGMGNKKWFYPVSAKSITYIPYQASDCASHMGDIHKAFDGNLDTVWSCPNSRVALILKFNDYVRIEKAKVHIVADLGGGSWTGSGEPSDNNTTYPYGTKHVMNGNYTIYLAANDKPKVVASVNKCLSSDPSKRAWKSGIITDKDCRLGSNTIETAVFWGGKTNIINTKIKQAAGTYGTFEFCDGICGTPQVDPGFWNIATKEVMLVVYQAQMCVGFMQKGSKSKCKRGNPDKNYVEIPDISFYGETFGEVTIPTEVEIGLLLRSPNEHQTKSKSFSMNMGNRTFTSNDRYMRDSFSTSVIIRNLYYATQ